MQTKLCILGESRLLSLSGFLAWQSMQMGDDRTGSSRLLTRELNQYLTCALCSGYLIDALTITECLHSFCKSCFIKYLQKPILVEKGPAMPERCVGCPACLSPLPKPRETTFRDSQLQNIVFKSIPRLHFSETKRRCEFDRRSNKTAGTSPSQLAVEQPVYVVLDHVKMDDLRKNVRSDCEMEPSKNGKLQLRVSRKRGSESLWTCSPTEADDNGKTSDGLSGNSERLHICCPAQMPLTTLKRFLTLKFRSEAVLFSDSELFDDAHWLEMRLGELLSLQLCLSVRGQRVLSMFELDHDASCAHFFFALLRD